MSRHRPTQKPRANHDVIVKLKHVGPIIAARWTGRHWMFTNGHHVESRSIECWWDMPTEEQLDRMEKS